MLDVVLGTENIDVNETDISAHMKLEFWWEIDNKQFHI